MSIRLKPGVYVGHIDYVTVKLEWIYHPKVRTFFADFGPYFGGPGHDIRDNKELVEWCDEHYCVMQRTWVECPDDDTAIMFRLRWT